MSRTKVFISYSHQDQDWRDRLMTHLAVMERREKIHVWTDTRINIGELWKTEIENALRESKVAVLLISPPFLASKFIWQEEIPRIMEHRKEGMLVLPLIARPCAWRSEPDLEQLQARPVDGRALSLGSDAQIDLDLTAFAYELESHLQTLSTHFAARSWEAAEQFHHARLPSDMSATDQPQPKNGNGPTLLPFLNEPLPLSWIGRYLPNQRIQLTILTASQDRVQGSITYLNDGTVTYIDGRMASDRTHLASDRIWSQINNENLGQVECAIEFRETGYEHQGTKGVDFNGKYFALVTKRSMVGVWALGNSILGHFSLERGESADSA